MASDFRVTGDSFIPAGHTGSARIYRVIVVGEIAEVVPFF